MKEILNDLEKLGFYSYEPPSLVPLIKALQLKNSSVWLTEGKYLISDVINRNISSEADEFMDKNQENGNNLIYLYKPWPLYRCFSLDKEDLYEYPPLIFEDDYLCYHFKKHSINVENADEYEDSDGNLHLFTNVGDFLICPAKFRSSFISNHLKWQTVITRIISMINSILHKSGSHEKIYALWEKDEEQIIVTLLDWSLFNLLNSNKNLKEEFLPQPIEKYFPNIEICEQ
ncbi:hypothetical protein [Laspinema olomoucense]|uniref:hypothetical protein n=1 Tax=Laspinema olomoucense TaxID=3231600 RepID=UPI0021BA79C4|nr:hypothetical protein [Laspinema sp. D3a]MCT7987850.1 hypothetical protein [Laspinema sp. D3a]